MLNEDVRMDITAEQAAPLYAGGVSVRCSAAPALGLVEGQARLPKLAHGGAHHFSWAGNCWEHAAMRPCPAVAHRHFEWLTKILCICADTRTH